LIVRIQQHTFLNHKRVGAMDAFDGDTDRLTRAGLQFADDFLESMVEMWCELDFSQKRALKKIRKALKKLHHSSKHVFWDIIEARIRKEMGIPFSRMLRISKHYIEKYIDKLTPLRGLVRNIKVHKTRGVGTWNLAMVDLPELLKYLLSNPDNFDLVRGYAHNPDFQLAKGLIWKKLDRCVCVCLRGACVYVHK
jgi:hypothetical protein